MATRHHQHDDLETLIELRGAEPVPHDPPPSFAPPVRTIRITPRTTAADKKLARWIAAGCDVWDYERIDGPFHHRDTNEWAERALNAGRERWRYQKKLTAKQVAAHRRGDITLRSAPVRKDIIRLRLDADAHHGETDARQLIEWINSRWFGGAVYHELSERGHAAYADIELPRLAWNGPADESPNGDGTYCEGARNINPQVQDVQAALKKVAAAAGFKASIEVNGRFEIRGDNDDKTARIIVTRGQTAKLPRCPDDTDIDRLIASRFTWSVLSAIVAEGANVVATPPAPAPAQPVLTSAVKRTARGRRRLHDTDDRRTNRWNCCREVALPFLPTVTDWNHLSADDQARLVDEANKLYVESGFAGGDRDKRRDDDFRHCFKKLFRTYDPSATPSGTFGGVWFDEVEDVREAERLLRSKLSRRELKRLRETPGLRGPMTYHTLAVALCIIAKTCNTAVGARRKEDVVATGIIGFLEHFGVTVNWTFARVVVETFERLDLLEVECNAQGRHSYWAGRHSRRMHLRGKARALRFVRHLYTLELKADTDNGQAARYLSLGGAGTVAVEGQYFLPEGMLYTPTSTTTHHDDDDDGYWSSLSVIELEFTEKQRTNTF